MWLEQRHPGGLPALGNELVTRARILSVAARRGGFDGGNRRVLLNKEANHGWNVIDFRTDEPETMLMSSGGAVATLNTKTGALHVQMRRNDDISYVQHDGDGNVLFAAGIPRTASRNK